MPPQFLIFGNLTREFILPAAGQPRLDAPGGSLLYAAAALRIWEPSVGLIGRVGDDYPRAWLNECKTRGLDTSGVKILPQKLDVRDFISYTDTFELSRINPISHFSRRGYTFPKSLLAYQPPDERPRTEARQLLVSDIPEDYLSARAALICPMDLSTQNQLIAGLKRGRAHTFVLDPSGEDMKVTAKR